MGTAGIFAVASENEGNHYSIILGVTSDGFENNLIYMASLFCEVTRGLQCLTQVRKNKWNSGVGRVIDAIDQHNDWGWFKDRSSNASWVSHSVVLDPKAGEIRVYEGKFEYLTKRIKIDVGKVRVKGDEAKKIVAAYKTAQKVAKLTPEERAAAARLEKIRQIGEAKKTRERKEAARRAALAKLTAEDRAALGV